MGNGDPPHITTRLTAIEPPMLTELDSLLQRHPELKAATRHERVAFLATELERLVREATRALQ